MAKESNYVKCVCDRCKHSAYVQQNSQQMNDWFDIEHINADGTPVKRFVDRACREVFLVISKTQDDEFNDFMANKTTAPVTNVAIGTPTTTEGAE